MGTLNPTHSFTHSRSCLRFCRSNSLEFTAYKYLLAGMLVLGLGLGLGLGLASLGLQPWARAIYFLQCLGQLSLLPSVGR